MGFYQEVLLIVISGIVGVVFGILSLTVKLGPRLTRMEQSMATRVETGLSKSDLSDFEIRFLERLNGRFLRSDIAQSLIERGNERWEAINDKVKRIEENCLGFKDRSKE